MKRDALMSPLAALACGLLISALAGCSTKAPQPGEPRSEDSAEAERPARPWSDAYLEGEARRYLDDLGFRREMLEASLTNPRNVYSRSRLSGYGIAAQGWEMLPEWIPKTLPIDEAYVEAVVAGAPIALGADARPLWNGVRPTAMADWVELGRRVFYEYPLRSEVFAEHALRSPELAERVGLRSDEHGLWPGLVAFESFEGGAAIGITCALCHVAIEGGARVEGRARRDFDYGELRLAFYRDTGAFLAEDLKRRMASWGPGRADITQDDDEDPVAIVDLWGVRNHEYLTQSGTLRQQHPAALAIRQETQILHANRERIRPPRELAWALAMFLYSIEAPERETAEPGSPMLTRGRELFDRDCQHCHRDASYGGLPIAVAEVGTDPVLANGSARGTGLYRPSPLIRVAAAAPYLHDGSVPSLEDLLDPKRSVPGHRFGSALQADDRQALLVYLRTL